ncbi:anaerobic sulfite reductase subunit AsrA [[Eubacterium] hominis]|uniref:anaerobic sulfite reductase subunit AsrA n=1 Tax=[Eubacterium] hominis TaxID=2764325 RepID=UPI003A4D493D
MSYEVSYEEANELFDALRRNYKIYAPKRLHNVGRYCDTDSIRYQEIRSVEEIEWKSRSDYSPKEVFYPINQTLFHYTEYGYMESQIFDSDLLIFARSCDIHGIQRLDKIFLENGTTPDPYYKRMRDKVHFILMECGEGWESCACCSMHTNKTDEYDMAIRFLPEENKLYVEVKNDKFQTYFLQKPTIEYNVKFIEKNRTEIRIPDINEDMLDDIRQLDMWKEYNSRCIGCGACNSACITCSCFNTIDTPYTENGKSGERRRTWTGCMNDDFTTVNGGHAFRDAYADRMRFKTMHKIYDYKKRFHTEDQMCVGCGRCDDICPNYISFSHIVNRLYDEVEKLKEEKQHE